MPQLVILGRDGVINRTVPRGVLSPDDFIPLPGSLEAIARLNHAGIPVAVTSNQPALADGSLTIETLNAVHGRLQQLLARVGGHVDGLFTCPHAPDSDCDCRKPRIGMLEEITARFDTPPGDSVMIGDDLVDIEAGRRAGAAVMLVRTGRGEETAQRLGEDVPFTADDLADAVEQLLRS